MKIAIIGATGLVGQKMLEILEERHISIKEMFPVGSKNSIGKSIIFNGNKYKVMAIEDAINKKPDFALFSAGGNVSLEYAPKFAETGTVVIDNSSAWRMDENTKLIVPEVNGHVLTKADKIIANPNCSTIQMVVALKPLHDLYKIKRIVVSTYQSVTGSGKKAVDQLMAERKGDDKIKAYPHPIDMNVLPHIDVFFENGYTKEEVKMLNETRKILNDPNIQLTATCVRIPAIGGHSEAVNIEFFNEFSIKEVRKLLQNAEGVTVIDDPLKDKYPMPLFSHEKDEVFVGRIRRDETQDKTLNLWIVSDNLRKGAATNTIQIVEYLLKKYF